VNLTTQKRSVGSKLSQKGAIFIAFSYYRGILKIFEDMGSRETLVLILFFFLLIFDTL
jgi:hypothetical protein